MPGRFCDLLGGVMKLAFRYIGLQLVLFVLSVLCVLPAHWQRTRISAIYPLSPGFACCVRVRRNYGFMYVGKSYRMCVAHSIRMPGQHRSSNTRWKYLLCASGLARVFPKAKKRYSSNVTTVLRIYTNHKLKRSSIFDSVWTPRVVCEWR